MSIRIGVGLGLGKPLPNDQYWRWVALCEDSGIDSIWHSDQLLGSGLEPMAMLAALAAATKRLRFGSNAVAVAYRDPLILAKEIATIDYLSGGRMVPVFGVGNAGDPVWAATGRNPKERGKKANEIIALVRRLLSEDNIAFKGAHFQYEGAPVLPRPAQPIPIWIGGDSEAAIQRTAALGDGWLGSFSTPSKAGEVVARIKAALTETERKIDPDHYGVIIPFRIGPADHPRVISYQRRMSARRTIDQDDYLWAIGDAHSVADIFKRYIEAGISKFVAMPIIDDGDDLMSQTRKLAEEILPAIEG